MPWCPKCKSPRQIMVTMVATGDLSAEDDIYSYPCLEAEAAKLTDEAYCMECEYEASLYEFLLPKKK